MLYTALRLVNQCLWIGSVRGDSRDQRDDDDDRLLRSRPRANLIDRPTSLKDSAYRAIKDQLVSGQLEPDKIYSAQHFAAMLGVSRTPIREAMLQLAGEEGSAGLPGGAPGFKIKRFSEREILRDVFEDPADDRDIRREATSPISSRPRTSGS